MKVRLPNPNSPGRRGKFANSGYNLYGGGVENGLDRSLTLTLAKACLVTRGFN